MTLLGAGDLAPSRSRRRRGAGPLVAVLSIVLLTAIAGGGYYLLFSGRGSQPGPVCPSASTSPRPARPLTAAAVHLRVLNGTGRNGLAKATGAQLRARGFPVDAVGNTSAPVAGPAMIRYGPTGRAGADLLALQLPQARLVGDPRLRGPLELVLGSGFSRLRTPAEVAAASRARNAARASAAPRTSPSCR